MISTIISSASISFQVGLRRQTTAMNNGGG